MILQSFIYEGQETSPVLEHSFFGRDAAECERVKAAHMKYDAFLRAAYERGVFQPEGGTPFPVHVVERWLP